jgi:nitrogen fixation/metabolism regulation signal transduction histidine kinase
MEHWRKIAMENPDIENSLKEKLKKIEYELKELRKAHKEKTKELNRQKRNIETVLRNLREVK